MVLWWTLRVLTMTGGLLLPAVVTVAGGLLFCGRSTVVVHGGVHFGLLW